jgi:hypothetical protein
LLAVAEEELGSYRGRAKARVDRQPGVQIELELAPVFEQFTQEDWTNGIRS